MHIFAIRTCAATWRIRLKFDNVNFGQNSNLEAVQGIDLGANRKRICNFLLAANSNFGRISSRTVFEIDAYKARQCHVFPHPTFV